MSIWPPCRISTAAFYDIARTIEPGDTLTYGDIAGRLGDKMLARAIGKALGENPFPIVIPCHRVLAASGQDGWIFREWWRHDEIQDAANRARENRHGDIGRTDAVRAATLRRTKTKISGELFLDLKCFDSFRPWP